jgi:hypothetical protein
MAIADRPGTIRPPELADFGSSDFMAADELQAIGAGLIDRHDNFSHLVNAEITYLWKKKGGQSGSRATLGKCQKPSGLLLHFAACDFVVWVAADHALALELTAEQLQALLFHELCHAQRETDEQGFSQFVVVKHDVEAFTLEIKRYGLWKEDLREMGAAVRQLRLDAGE